MKKKKWFNVELEFPSQQVDILLDNPEEVNEKDKVILLDLTRFLKGKVAEAKYKVIMKNSKLFGKIFYFRLIQTYVRRLVRKGTSYAEDSFVTETKDKVKVRIKPLLVTRKKVPRSLLRSLRNTAREFIVQYAKNKSRKELFEDIIMYNLQKEMIKILKKIYPLSVCEIRMAVVEKK